MIDLENGKKQALADWPHAQFVAPLETYLNPSKLACQLGDTRARIESMVRRGRIPVAAVTDDGKLLFRISELPAYRAAYLAEMLYLQNRKNGITITPNANVATAPEPVNATQPSTP